MKEQRQIIDIKFIGQVMLSILLGGLIGLLIEHFTKSHNAVLICAIGSGVASIWRLRNKKPRTVDSSEKAK